MLYDRRHVSKNNATSGGAIRIKRDNVDGFVGPCDLHRRKQKHPQRSLKPLSTEADKTMSGVITIEPLMPWETSSGTIGARHTASRYRFLAIMNDNLNDSGVNLMNLGGYGKKRDGGSDNIHDYQSDEEATVAHILGGKTQFFYEDPKSKNHSSRSDDSDSSIEAQRSPMRKKKNNGRGPKRSFSQSPVHSPQRSVTPTAGGSTISSQSATVSRSPAPIGVHVHADLDAKGVAHRKELYEALVTKRRAGSGMGTPLDISSAPGSSLLQDDEFDICCGLRLYPLQYFYSRDTLVANYESRGFYKKSAAQKMLHIDVNKTGKLYDFLISKGWLPTSSESAVLGEVRDLPPTAWRTIDHQ